MCTWWSPVSVSPTSTLGSTSTSNPGSTVAPSAGAVIEIVMSPLPPPDSLPPDSAPVTVSSSSSLQAAASSASAASAAPRETSRRRGCRRLAAVVPGELAVMWGEAVVIAMLRLRTAAARGSLAERAGLPRRPAAGCADGVARDPLALGRSTEDVWEVSDEALFAGYASGDPEAAARFVDRFQRRVYGLALAIVRVQVDAEEVAQEAFVRAWRFAASFDERRGSVAAWLLGITRNVALDSVRGRGRRPEPVAQASPDLAVDPLDVGGAIERRADARRVAELMGSLPERQRQALVAVTLWGMTTREVSEMAGIPQGTVKTRVRLALRKLRDEMGVQVP